MKKLTVTAVIRDSHPELSEKSLVSYGKFLVKNEGEKVSMTYEVLDTPEHWQHKYFHGYLLRDIAEAQGEKDLWYLKHMILKSMYLFKKVDSHNDIPTRFKKGCRIITSGTGDKEKIVGYIPSLADLTYDEMHKFITQCEILLFEDLMGHLGQGSNQNTAMEFRKNAMAGRILR